MIFYPSLCSCTADASISDGNSIVVVCDTVWDENSLHKAIASIDADIFSFIGIVGDLGKDMTFIIRAVIVFIDHADGVVKLHPVLEPKTTTRNTRQPPSRLNLYPDASRNFDSITWVQSKREGGSEVIPCRP